MKSIAPRSNLVGHFPRQHYNSARKAKRTFFSEQEAEDYIKEKHLEGYTIYLCKICNHYHISHKNKK